jgi:hypothetical protein
MRHTEVGLRSGPTARLGWRRHVSNLGSPRGISEADKAHIRETAILRLVIGAGPVGDAIYVGLDIELAGVLFRRLQQIRSRGSVA